jgi:hypothetical protein
LVVCGVVVGWFDGGGRVVEEVGGGVSPFFFFSWRFFILFSDLAEKWGMRAPTRGSLFTDQK